MKNQVSVLIEIRYHEVNYCLQVVQIKILSVKYDNQTQFIL